MNGQLTVGSLFAGIGGFDLGLERAGMRVIWQSEIDPYASAVLRKHWPAVPNLGDIRGISAATLADAERTQWRTQASATNEQYGHDGGRQEAAGWTRERGALVPDILCGGFPCQDISNAGKRAGIGGERSGLWAEFARLIGELRPRYVIVENVAALLGRGIERVLGDLAALGFDAEWHCIPASAVGAPHRRDRVWIVAYDSRGGCGEGRQGRLDSSSTREPERALQTGAHAEGVQRAAVVGNESNGTIASSQDVADSDEPRLQGWLRDFLSERANQQLAWESGAFCTPRRDKVAEIAAVYTYWWGVESPVGRVAHGIPRRVDRLRCLGNAIVPQIAEIIGRAIVSAEQ